MEKKRKFVNFYGGLTLGILAGFALAFLTGQKLMTTAHAKKPSQLDIIYNVASLNYYQTQKVLAYEKYNAELAILNAGRNKVKAERIVPLTNALQQEIFTLDLKIKELNK